MAGAHTWVDNDIFTATRGNALPRGVMGYATKSADQAGISSVTDITSLSVTFTAISTRLYRTTINVGVTQLTSTGNVVVIVADGASTTIQQGVVTMSASTGQVVNVVVVETGLSGSTTRKGRISTSAGTVTVEGSATLIASIVVEDMGPAA